MEYTSIADQLYSGALAIYTRAIVKADSTGFASATACFVDQLAEVFKKARERARPFDTPAQAANDEII